MDIIAKNPGKLFKIKDNRNHEWCFIQNHIMIPNWATKHVDIIKSNHVFIYLSVDKNLFELDAYEFLTLKSTGCQIVTCYDLRFLLDLEAL